MEIKLNREQQKTSTLFFTFFHQNYLRWQFHGEGGGEEVEIYHQLPFLSSFFSFCKSFREFRSMPQGLENSLSFFVISTSQNRKGGGPSAKLFLTKNKSQHCANGNVFFPSPPPPSFPTGLFPSTMKPISSWYRRRWLIFWTFLFSFRPPLPSPPVIERSSLPHALSQNIFYCPEDFSN